ncbi:J domain-containing protein [Oceanispirochaeta sp.]|jgi:curved DNA-binding protein CbpA|uniref:J domain-containing protein n=1 Tax=Oceanispirochaeta sp. TaxID=2035350 RepID=UPI00260466C9|nr:J domain-containing protein [Oceanispirochaeta sp.]MDA3955156.1 J domain-containing protein [Oceanispirochaeta sp.]
MMIFKLENDFSKSDLQKSYKILVKKYHPDSNPKNQDWSHKKMTEINLAYETCNIFLGNKIKDTHDFNKEEVKKQEKEPIFHKKNNKSNTKTNNITPNGEISQELYLKIKEFSYKIILASEKFFEYGLENRKLRYEGVRRFRYRECLRLFDKTFSDVLKLEKFCRHDYDHYSLNLFIRFTGNFNQYILLKDNDIPRHPLLNKHWLIMEDYLIQCIKDYLVPYQVVQYKKLHWKTAFTQSWNQLIYIGQRFPALEKDEVFLIFYNLTDSYRNIRKEEQDHQTYFFRSL